MSSAAATPLVSVVIPAFQAGETLRTALASVAAAGLPPERVEVVIAPDDGQGYDDLPDHGLTLTRCATHHMATGAGPARNRAIARARGAFIAFLDADDTWAPGYLAALLPLAQRHGAAFGRTRVLLGKQPLLHLPGPAQSTLGLADLGRTGCSFHPLAQRVLVGPFRNRAAQDVLHTMEVLSLVGGRAPLAKTSYNLHLNPQSTTARNAFAQRAQQAYYDHIRAIGAGQTRIAPGHGAAARHAFESKARLNRAYIRSGKAQFFYQFMQERLAAEQRTAAVQPDPS
ncbi:Glycosyl transferase family 2 [Roseovarius azorensis]|uniref:Glycosyl transferase family 2 n=1 Tax=Roseovarius azorensis TaxID=1287727 RepID=A0A1H7PU21_9RHOB|nr:glycosyltransferase [Roseovarius azorensis]SEL38735.1 Glycosyl transferase family 2 [Roseovarius azorensis]